MAYSPGVTAAIIAADAATKKHRQQLEEEEKMTTYSREELENDWEFKIVRSATGAFRNPTTLRQLIEEEARAGWDMVEKFDDARVRFKRPRSARQRDPLLPPDVNPYRTSYGTMSNQALVAIVMVMVGLTVLAVLGTILLVLVG